MVSVKRVKKKQKKRTTLVVKYRNYDIKEKNMVRLELLTNKIKKKGKKIGVRRAGFEPAHLTIVELESTALDHSAICALVETLYFISNIKYPLRYRAETVLSTCHKRIYVH